MDKAHLLIPQCPTYWMDKMKKQEIITAPLTQESTIKTTLPKGGLLQGYKPVLPTAPKDAGLHFVQAIEVVY